MGIWKLIGSLHRPTRSVPGFNPRRALCVLVLSVFGMAVVAAQERSEDALDFAEASLSDLSLEEIDQQLNNPLTSLWSLTLQENLSLKSGDRYPGTKTANTLFFQPALPVPLGKDMVFTFRPVFPLVTAPVPDASSASGTGGSDTGFGDIQLMTP